VCCICFEELSPKPTVQDLSPVVTPCLHVACFSCLRITRDSEHASSFFKPKSAPFKCPLCRTAIRITNSYVVVAPTLEEEQAASSSSSSSSGAGASSSSTSTSTAPVDPRWTAAMEQDEVRERLSTLPAGVSAWDPYRWSLAGLTKEFRTYLRVAAGVLELPAGSKAVPTRLSTKVARVVQDVAAHAGKVVVFSQFTKVVDLVAAALELRGVRANKVTRGMSASHVARSVDEFSAGEGGIKALCVHAGAGAAGLTLTAADAVFMVEPFLSAGEEAQAMNRVHRLGQAHAVVTRRYFVRGTVEERILAHRGVVASAQPALDDAVDLVALPQTEEAKSARVTPAFLAYALGERAVVDDQPQSPP